MAVSLMIFDSIKKQIADAKNKSAKAEGAKERLIAQLSEDFDIENGMILMQKYPSMMSQ